MGATSAALKKIADAADPLYKTLDEGQKRRLAVLTRHRGPFGGGEDGPPRHFMERGMDRMMERGMDHFHGDRFDRDEARTGTRGPALSLAADYPGINLGEAAGIQRLFAFSGLWKSLGKHAPHRLPDPDRFAKRPASQGIDRLSGA